MRLFYPASKAGSSGLWVDLPRRPGLASLAKPYYWPTIALSRRRDAPDAFESLHRSWNEILQLENITPRGQNDSDDAGTVRPLD
jgi:hypothetical protein